MSKLFYVAATFHSSYLIWYFLHQNVFKTSPYHGKLDEYSSINWLSVCVSEKHKNMC